MKEKYRRKGKGRCFCLGDRSAAQSDRPVAGERPPQAVIGGTAVEAAERDPTLSRERKREENQSDSDNFKNVVFS